MATYLGKDGVVEVETNAVANIETFTYNEEGAKVPTPFMGAGAIVELAGFPRVNGRVRCWYDDADTLGQGALVQGATVALTLYPRGVGAGLPQIAIASADIDTEVLEVPVENGISVEFGYSATAKGVRSVQS